MYINTKTNSIDQIIDVTPWNLAEEGYGPLGDYSREAWRKLCWQKLQSGKDEFIRWQHEVLAEASGNISFKRFELELKLASGDNKLVSPWGEFRHDIVPAFGMPRYSLDFSGYIHSHPVNLNQYTFILQSIFAYSTFNDYVRISGCHFHERIEIGWVKFLAHADFTGTYFSKFTKFSQSLFFNHANYSDCHFEDQVLFDFVIYKNAAIYNKSNFKNTAVFTGINFCDLCEFKNVNFEERVSFQYALFEKNTNFFKVKFNNQSQFERSIFKAAVNFENCDLQNVGHFEYAKFEGEFPNFLGVDNAKTLLVFSEDEFFTKNDTSEDAVKRIGQLKRLSDEQGQTDQALMFNKFELNAKRAQARIKTESLTFLQKLGNADFWFANATALYDKFSDYGRSFTRPLLAYGALMLVTLLLALGHGLWASMDACKREGWNVYEQLNRDQVSCPVVATVGEQKIPLSVPRAAFEYTAYRASGVLDFVDADKQTIAVANRLFNQPIEPMWMRIWGVLKAIASAALLFLAALGLRNKYRIK